MIRKTLATAAVVMALPIAAQAQSLQYPGFYIGAEGGGTWMFHTTTGTPLGSGTIYPDIGWAAGGMVGYDFVGPRVELEGIYRRNTATVGAGPFNAFGAAKDDIGDPRQHPVRLQRRRHDRSVYRRRCRRRLRQDLGARRRRPTPRSSPTRRSSASATTSTRCSASTSMRATTARPARTSAGNTYSNNNISAMLSLQVKFGAPSAAPPPPAAPPAAAPSFMVFFDWDRSNLSQQALNTIRQAADAFKTKGNARITATGHADTSGPENYNMALSLRRANAVKDALVRTACRRRRSRSSARARASRWSRPPTACASRRTAASRSSSSRSSIT